MMNHSRFFKFYFSLSTHARTRLTSSLVIKALLPNTLQMNMIQLTREMNAAARSFFIRKAARLEVKLVMSCCVSFINVHARLTFVSPFLETTVLPLRFLTHMRHSSRFDGLQPAGG